MLRPRFDRGPVGLGVGVEERPLCPDYRVVAMRSQGNEENDGVGASPFAAEGSVQVRVL